MKELYAVYLESLDQELRVYTDKAEAKKRVEELTAEGKSPKVQLFGSHQIISFNKSNGCSAKDPSFWEEIRYDNGRYILIETFCWHEEPEPEGYYADYILS